MGSAVAKIAKHLCRRCKGVGGGENGLLVRGEEDHRLVRGEGEVFSIFREEEMDEEVQKSKGRSGGMVSITNLNLTLVLHCNCNQPSHHNNKDTSNHNNKDTS